MRKSPSNAGTPGQWSRCFCDQNPEAGSAWEVQIRTISPFLKLATSVTNTTKISRPWWKEWRLPLPWPRLVPSKGSEPSSGTRYRCLAVKRLTCGATNTGLAWAGTTQPPYTTIQVLLASDNFTNVMIFNHPGAAKMGPASDPQSVVNHELKV